MPSNFILITIAALFCKKPIFPKNETVIANAIIDLKVVNDVLTAAFLPRCGIVQCIYSCDGLGRIKNNEEKIYCYCYKQFSFTAKTQQQYPPV